MPQESRFKVTLDIGPNTISVSIFRHRNHIVLEYIFSLLPLEGSMRQERTERRRIIWSKYEGEDWNIEKAKVFHQDFVVTLVDNKNEYHWMLQDAMRSAVRAEYDDYYFDGVKPQLIQGLAVHEPA